MTQTEAFDLIAKSGILGDIPAEDVERVTFTAGYYEIVYRNTQNIETIQKTYYSKEH